MRDKPLQSIRLRGVRHNNLKNLNIDLPLGKLIVVTGLSGAGKSSLVFDTLHAEGQRRYVETFSAYTRQFMEMMDRPKVDSVENIRPSIAIEQGNTVKTSRSTVGTMTELCDYFKVWFCHKARLFDPVSGREIIDDNPLTIWNSVFKNHSGETLLLAFSTVRPASIEWEEILRTLLVQGFTRGIHDGVPVLLESLRADQLKDQHKLTVIQDRIKIEKKSRDRFLESVRSALHYGQGKIQVYDSSGMLKDQFAAGLHAPDTGLTFRPATPNLFSFNSPLGACDTCRGFGRVIEIDYNLVIPDHSKTLKGEAIRAFQGEVYSESQRDLMRACSKHKIRTDIPWSELSDHERQFVMEGEPGYVETKSGAPSGWYGVRRFFAWLEANTYKMHVRIFLSKYRTYVECPVCNGNRLKPESMCWKWQGMSLPELYRLPVSELLPMIELAAQPQQQSSHQCELAEQAILTRLRYLKAVGLSYLSLDRTSRTLSGGETQRVNLTSCLGAALVDTLFVLDEPSVGLHARDIDRLIAILRNLTSQGNTVVVVEHDEAIMRAADWIVEVGPEPGHRGGKVVANGTLAQVMKQKHSLTSLYLSGRRTVTPPEVHLPVIPGSGDWLRIRGASKHNLNLLDIDIPLERLVVLSGVSGSGKSTLLNNVIYQGALVQSGKMCDDPANIQQWQTPHDYTEIVMVDQSPISRTPRSNPVLFVDAWTSIRKLLANTTDSLNANLTHSHFSFNSGEGRCPHCEGLGYEKVEMQFMADLYVVCPFCNGKRFKPQVLEIKYEGKSVDEILAMNVTEARLFFAGHSAIEQSLAQLEAVGLAYLPLGQPINTLSGGESQRLKLVKYLARFQAEVESALILIDEPTTGLHREDVGRLIGVLQELVKSGHSVVVIEHQMDVLRAADWIIEMGPEAGAKGGRVVFNGTPGQLARSRTATAPFLLQLEDGLDGEIAAEAAAEYLPVQASQELRVTGAREHNLKNISVSIPHGKMTVVTGVSGSGKSTLAFDIIFAEGQRRFMESMSSWARQYVEQLPRPEIDQLSGIQPTVAIEQRVTHGTYKSTVATITEVAQYLRLLYARVGIQHSPVTGEPLLARTPEQIEQDLTQYWQNHSKHHKGQNMLLLVPLIRGRKGHYETLFRKMASLDYKRVRVDKKLIQIHPTLSLERFQEHDVELVMAELTPIRKNRLLSLENEETGLSLGQLIANALAMGDNTFLLTDQSGNVLRWFSTSRTDPTTGEAFQELDPKNFSWNSAKGWCPTCRGYGRWFKWMEEHDAFTDVAKVDDESEEGTLCPDCDGQRLSKAGRSVYLNFNDSTRMNLPELLALTPDKIVRQLAEVNTDTRGQTIVNEVYPEIRDRLAFMKEVGLDYLSLDRPTNTLSGGEAQRIRLAAQLGSNLSGVLYVLDEPSIGLHARDNDRLLQSLEKLRGKQNTLLVVEHDPETMRHADQIIDLGPGAGRLGGEVLAIGNLLEITNHPNSLTGKFLREGMPHPMRGSYRPLPKLAKTKNRIAPTDWLVLEEPRLRNLKGGLLTLPKGRLSVICGISGAGKSTLIRDLLRPAVEIAIAENNDDATGRQLKGLPLLRLRGAAGFKKVIEVDQRPIGKTPRSTPATYIGAFDIIRQFFGSLPDAQLRGHSASSFSFNTTGGRCETCKGAGTIKLEMSFMPDSYVLCDDCGGSRFGPDLMEMRWKDKNISDVLNMSFAEAEEFFSFHNRLHGLLKLMVETGLGYLTLGQSSPTLSGGEAQRLKLVSELALGLPSWKDTKRGASQRNLYILEEPTIGLHMSDCVRLTELLHRMVDQGHTVIVIEHNLDVIAEADYVVEIGPDGGSAGGEIMYQGPVNGLAEYPPSPTAPFLRGVLQA